MNQSISSQSAAPAAGDVGELSLKLLVLGFNQSERQLLDAVVRLSQRRQPRIDLLGVADAQRADVVMVDAADAQARKWAGGQPWLKQKAVVWVDGSDAAGQTVVHRPVMWSSLPQLLARVLEQAPANSAGAARQTHGSVLVVDDSVAVRAQLRSLLEARGLTVSDVDNADAAIEMATSAPFGCVLMDVLMPGTDGYEACRQIKANTHGGNRPAIVMLTSKSSPFDRIRGKMAGCDAYLTKPIEPDHLYEVVSRYIAKAAESAAAASNMAPAQFA